MAVKGAINPKATFLSDEDFKLVLEALDKAGWVARHNFGTVAYTSDVKNLRVVLQSLIEGKAQDMQDEVTIPVPPADLTDDQAFKLLYEAAADIMIDVTVDIGHDAIDNSTLTMKLYRYQITTFINYIKNRLWG